MSKSKLIVNKATFELLPYYFLFLIVALSISCSEHKKQPGEVKHEVITAVDQQDTAKHENGIEHFKSHIVTEMSSRINCIIQDKNDNYWFSTNGDGVYCYDGKSLYQFNTKDGLSDDYVGAIQEDMSGHIWFTTASGISRFNGRAFISYTVKDSLPLKSSSDKEWKTEPGDLWFNAGGGAYRYNGKSFSYLALPKAPFDSRYSQGPSDRLSAYGVYSILKDKNGTLWFGTQAMGVCHYDGTSFTWLNEKGLSPPAVRCVFEDRNRNLWFGNNGAGLFRYDGKTLVNFTDEKGLSNPEFWSESKISGKSRPGTLARVWTINEDNNGNLWIGTTDAGVWRYDGNSFTNYTTIDGLTSNSINTIYKDKKGDLWFGTDGGGLCKYNGTFFTRFDAK